MKLNIGCGKDIKEGWVNCDNAKGDLPKGVIRVDLSKPLPFPDQTFDEILASHVLEHIVEYANTVDECFRVLEPKGIMTIRTPYGMNYDARHIRFLKPESMNHWILANEDATSLEVPQKKTAKCVSLVIRRTFWLGWHLEHYLGIKALSGKRYRFPIGRKAEIIWILEKLGDGQVE